MRNTLISRVSNMIIIVEPQARYHEVQRWRHSHKNKEKAEKQKIKKALAKSCREIVATFFDHHGKSVKEVCLHRKLLHINQSQVEEGFFIAYDASFSTVKTNLFNATLQKVTAHTKDPNSVDRYHYREMWWIRPDEEGDENE